MIRGGQGVDSGGIQLVRVKIAFDSESEHEKLKCAQSMRIQSRFMDHAQRTTMKQYARPDSNSKASNLSTLVVFLRNPMASFRSLR